MGMTREEADALIAEFFATHDYNFPDAVRPEQLGFWDQVRQIVHPVAQTMSKDDAGGNPYHDPNSGKFTTREGANAAKRPNAQEALARFMNAGIFTKPTKEVSALESLIGNENVRATYSEIRDKRLRSIKESTEALNQQRTDLRDRLQKWAAQYPDALSRLSAPAWEHLLEVLGKDDPVAIRAYLSEGAATAYLKFPEHALDDPALKELYKLLVASAPILSNIAMQINAQSYELTQAENLLKQTESQSASLINDLSAIKPVELNHLEPESIAILARTEPIMSDINSATESSMQIRERNELTREVLAMLDPEGEKSLDDYIGPWYADINGAFRTEKGATRFEGKYRVEGENIKRLFTKLPPTPEDMVVWRGVRSGRSINLGSLKPGDEIVTSGFTSTSASLSTAKEWNSTLMEIHIPKGSKDVLLTSNAGEAEVLLNDSSRLEYVGTRLAVRKVRKWDQDILETYNAAVFTYLGQGVKPKPRKVAKSATGDVYLVNFGRFQTEPLILAEK